MSRWTKGELTIGEIAQMERKLVDIKSRLAFVPIKVDATPAERETVSTFAACLVDLTSIVDLMLKG